MNKETRRPKTLKLNKSNIPYTAKEPPNEIPCLESTGNAPNKKPHLRLINPICLSPL